MRVVTFYINMLRRIQISRIPSYLKMLIAIISEKKRGIDFSIYEPQDDLLVSQQANPYEFSPEAMINKVLDYVDIDSDTSFLDIGCGKGLVLYVASKRPFKKCAGIEINSKFADIAKHNFKKLHLDHRVEIFECDAIKFTKYREFNVFYFFNPFSIEIQNLVIEKIIEEKCLRNGGGPVWLLTYHTSAAEYIQNTGLFELLEQYRDTERGHVVSVWKTLGA